MADQESTTDRQRTFGIGAVAKMTGLSDHTIRVWERRYSAVVADRAANGRRIYRPADIEKLKLLKLLTDNGVSIGRIAAESLESLMARVEEMRELVAPVQPETEVSVAILGELLPALLKDDSPVDRPIRLLASSSQEAQLLADLGGQSPDVLVVELPVVSVDMGKTLKRLKKSTGSGGVVCVYGFSRSRDSDKLRDSGVFLVRAPVTIDEAVEAILRAAESAARPRPARLVSRKEQSSASISLDDGTIEPRRFSQQELSALARQSSAIDCECPQHLADLVGALSAFEIYSANCVSRSEADQALHRYLHRTTASARSLLEQALERVAREEGLI